MLYINIQNNINTIIPIYNGCIFDNTSGGCGCGGCIFDNTSGGCGCGGCICFAISVCIACDTSVNVACVCVTCICVTCICVTLYKLC